MDNIKWIAIPIGVLVTLASLYIIIEVTVIPKEKDNRDYEYERYLDSIYTTNPGYYFDVVVETDKFQDYINTHKDYYNEINN